MQYHVLLDVNCGEYPPGSVADFNDTDAQPLLDAGVISLEPGETAPVAEPVEEQPAPQPVVGGAPDASGEPSIDTPVPAVSGPTVDVTPVVDNTPAEAPADAPAPVVDAPVADPAPVVDPTPDTDPSANL